MWDETHGECRCYFTKGYVLFVHIVNIASYFVDRELPGREMDGFHFGMIICPLKN